MRLPDSREKDTNLHHLSTARTPAHKETFYVCIIRHSLNSHISTPNSASKRIKERRPNKNTDIAWLRRSASPDNGHGSATAGEAVFASVDAKDPSECVLAGNEETGDILDETRKGHESCDLCEEAIEVALFDLLDWGSQGEGEEGKENECGRELHDEEDDNEY